MRLEHTRATKLVKLRYKDGWLRRLPDSAPAIMVRASLYLTQNHEPLLLFAPAGCLLRRGSLFIRGLSHIRERVKRDQG